MLMAIVSTRSKLVEIRELLGFELAPILANVMDIHLKALHWRKDIYGMYSSVIVGA